MQKLVVFSLLVCLAGYGLYQLNDGTSDSTVPMTSVAWFPQEQEEDASQQEETASEEATEEEAADDSVESIIEDFDAAMAEFMEAYNAAESQDAKRKLFRESYPQPNDFAGRLMVLVEEDPAAESSADALAWIVQRVRGPMSNEATELLVEHHIKSEAMADIAMTKGRDIPSQENQDFLQRLMDESPVERVQGVAAYSKVMQIQQGQRRYRAMKNAAEKAQTQLDEQDDGDDDEMAEQRMARVRAQIEAYQRYHDSLSSVASAIYEHGETEDGTTMETLFDSIVENYGDVVLAERGDEVITIGERCESTLFEIRYLSIGKTAPDIEGEDLDGEEFNLSDYRGKVVVIDFWGDW
ncbi:MAG: peroxiredoxin family protein [Pirellulaceae bacterium]